MKCTYENSVGDSSGAPVANDGVVATPVVDQKHPDTQGVVLEPGTWLGTCESRDAKFAVRLKTCHWRGLNRIFKTNNNKDVTGVVHLCIFV